MKVIPLGQAKAPIEDYIAACEADGPVVFTRKGTAVAVLRPPLDDEELYRLRLAYSPQFQAFLDRCRKGKTLSADEFWKRVEEENANRERAKKKKPKKQPA